MKASISSEKFRVVKDFPCGDGSTLRRNSEIVLDGPVSHPDLVGSEAVKAIINFGLIEKQDGNLVHLTAKRIDESRLEPERQIIVVPNDFGTYLERIS